jgi:mevalonate kinase
MEILKTELPKEIKTKEEYKNLRILFEEFHKVYKGIYDKIEQSTKKVKILGSQLENQKDADFQKIIRQRIDKYFQEIQDVNTLYLDIHQIIFDIKKKIELYSTKRSKK